MTETWTQWKPINGLYRKYDIDEIVDNKTGFMVILSELETQSKKIKIHFKESVESYCCADETLRCAIIADLHTRYGTAFYGDWTFFTVTDSHYIRWLSEQSCTISDGMALVHFSILAANTILDIAAISTPTVEHI